MLLLLVSVAGCAVSAGSSGAREVKGRRRWRRREECGMREGVVKETAMSNKHLSSFFFSREDPVMIHGRRSVVCNPGDRGAY